MKKFFLLMLALFAVVVASAQTRTVTGQVIFENDGEPLIGATVVPVGMAGNVGTATDLDGNFTLKVANDCHQLKVSYVGMTTATVDITGQPLLIKLHSSQTQLDEVMVVAYGTAKRSAFTGSATVIDASAIEQTQANNALNALTGKVSGVQINNQTGEPGASNPTIRIRGVSSVNASNSPLIVLDGTPYSGDVNNINPNDIESMTILKDAASNALYGARGANGVILITTKKGAKGEARVTLDASWGSNSKATSDYETIDDPRAYMEAFGRAYYNYAINNGQAPADALAFVNRNVVNQLGGYSVFSYPEGENLFVDGSRLNPNATLGSIYTNPYTGEQLYLTPDNWRDAAYKHGLRQDYNLSVSKSDDKYNFFASFGYLSNEGIVDNTNYKRITGRLSADIMAKSWLKIGGNVSYTNASGSNMGEQDAGSTTSSGNIFAITNQIAPIYPLYIRNAQGQIMTDPANGLRLYDYGDGEWYGVRPILSSSNAVQQQQLDSNDYRTNSVNGNGFFEVRFLRDFKFTSNNAFSYTNTRSKSYVNPYYGQYADMRGQLYVESAGTLDYQFQQLLNWSHDFGLHSVAVLLGHENYWKKYDYLTGNRSNSLLPLAPEMAGYVIVGSTTSYTTDYNTEGWFGRVNYNYDNRYFGSASFRRDGSSRFDPSHRWGNFWSIGAAWLISSEKFMEPYEWVNNLKLKFSYGEQGNDGIPDFLYRDTYEVINSDGVASVKPYRKGNADITWEKGGNLNAGVEFGLFNNRLSGQIEGFWRKTSDMLFSFPMPPSMGYTSYYDNIGDMVNKGFEIELNGTVINTRDLTWSINANLTWYKNRITRLAEENKTLKRPELKNGKMHPGFSSGNYFIGENQSIYTYHMKAYAGTDDEGHALYYYQDTDENGNTVRKTTTSFSGADYYLCGTALPSVYGGFGTKLQWREFDFSVDFTYQLGGKVLDTDYMTLMTAPSSGHRGYAIHKDALDSWTAERPTDIPVWQYMEGYNDGVSDRWLTSASCLTLQNLNFGYSLPGNITRKIGIERVRFYLNCDNLATWSKRKGLDPRQSINGETTNAFYAPIRTVSGGINVTF
ncbi:MAG: TonB-dependent receptor [Paramuribaculum sp.]|nr:TonB-dependent receptor [Paramuribaculum sp.]